MSDALGDQEIAGFAADALHALTPAQIVFLRALSKAELHAHLNGCIPVQVLRKLAAEQLDVASVSQTVELKTRQSKVAL